MDSAEIVFQYAADSSWPSGDGGWIADRAVDVDSACDGAGQVVGHATGEKRYGKIKRPYDDEFTIDPMPLAEPSLGRWCRLLRANSSGDVILMGIAGRFSAFWWGYVAATTRSFGGTVKDQAVTITQGRTIVRMTGLMGHFAQVFILDGYEISGAQNPQRNFMAHAFNAPVPNRSTNAVYPHPVTGISTHVANSDMRGDSTPPESWTAVQALEYISAVHLWRHAPWIIDNQSGSAGNVELPGISTNGRRVIDVINEIANERTGLTYRVDVVDHKPRLVLLKYPPDSGDVLDVRDDRKIVRVELSEDTTIAADHVIVVGERPVNTCTLYYSISDTSANLEPASDWTSGSTVDVADPHDTAWRQFRVRRGASVAGLRTILSTDGNGAFTGTRTQDSAGVGPSSRSAKMDRHTGFAADGGSPTVGPVDPDNRGAFRLFIRATGASNSWQDWSDRVSVLPISEPPGIELGGSAAMISAISDMIKAGGELRVTVGIREPAALRKSSRSTTGKQRGDREILRQVSGSDEAWHSGSPAPALTVDTSGYLQVAGSSGQTIDLTAPLAKELSRLTAGYQRAAQTALSYEARGLYFTTPPGTCISTLRTQAGDIDVSAVIVRRSWVFSEGRLSTSLETERPVEGKIVL